MQIVYDKIFSYSKHPQAFWILMLVAFTESFVFPFPPDLLMMLMILSVRNDAWKLAAYSTVASVLGGVIGYFIGFGLYQTVGLQVIDAYGYQEQAGRFQDLAKDWGFWIIALKGFTPIPFKVVTILSGAAQVPFHVFIFASIIARSSRFFIFAFLLWFFGERMKGFVEKRLGIFMFGMLAIIVLGFWLIKVLL